MIKRRQVLQLSAGMLAVRSVGLAAEAAASTKMSSNLIKRPIPSSGEMLPVIGMGTWQTFDKPADAAILANLTQVMQAFFVGGGSVIDTSPMYGQAESRVGDILRQMPGESTVFAATKVWTTGKESGIAQMQASAKRSRAVRRPSVNARKARVSSLLVGCFSFLGGISPAFSASSTSCQR